MPKKDDEFLQEARDRFSDAYTNEDDNRNAAHEDDAFENGEQWTPAEKLDRLGRPCPVVNKTSGTIKQIVGDARQNRPRIKIRPVDNAADPKVAELLTGLIRNIENVSDAEGAYDNGLECAARGGYGYWRVLTEYADDVAFEQDIRIARIENRFSVTFGYSEKSDYSDARYCFVSEMLSDEEFKAKYPNASKVDFEHDTISDWILKDKQVRVSEYWYKEQTTKKIFELADGRVIEVKSPQVRKQAAVPASQVIDQQTGQPVDIPAQPETQWVFGDGMEQPMQFTRSRSVKCDKVMWAKINGTEILEGPQEWAGKYIPIIPCLGEEVWIDGKRVLRSAIRFAKEPARIYNWTRANAIEIMAMGPKQPWIVTEKMIEGHEQMWQQAHRKPTPYLLTNADGNLLPQRQQLDISTSGIHQEALLAADDIKATTGIFDASLGAQGNETSGKAIIARQRQGNTATFVFSDNQVRAIKYTGRILVDLIPKIYDTQRVVRLVGDDLKKTMGQHPGIQVAPDGMSAWAKINVLGPDGKVIANDLSVGRYDVVVDAGPGYATKRMEAADGLLQALPVVPQFAPIILPRLAKNLDWPEAQEMADEIKQASQPQQAPPDPRIQADMQMKQADIELKKLDLAGKQMDLQGKQLDIQAKAQETRQAAIDGQQNNDQHIYQVASKAIQDALKQLGVSIRPGASGAN